MPGIGDGAHGDALVEVAVAPHPLFRREGDDIIVELPVTLQEAVLGTSLEVPTIKGPVRLTIPPIRHAARGCGCADEASKDRPSVRRTASRAAAGGRTGAGRIPEDLEAAPSA